MLTAHPPQSAPDLDEVAQHLLVRQALRALVARLPQPLQYVIIARYGLTGEDPQTCSAIGQVWGVTHQQVSQWHT